MPNRRWSPSVTVAAVVEREGRLTPGEVESCAGRHRSPLLWRCITRHRAGKCYALDLLNVDPSLFVPQIM